MEFPSIPELLRRTGVALLVTIALATGLYVGVVTQALRLGGLSRGDLVPWYSTFDPRLSPASVLGVVVCGIAVAWGPRLAEARRAGRFLLGAMGLVVVVWAGVALSDGEKVGERRTGLVPANGLTYPFERTAQEYIGDVPKVERYGVRGLLRSWPTDEVQNTLAWHSRTHPPGAVMLLAGLERIGLGGAFRSALAVLLLGALSLLPAYRFARLHLAPRSARTTTLLFGLAPGTTLFFATSMETVFTLLAVTALWAMSAAARTPLAGRGVVAALGAGGTLAIAAFFTWAALLPVLGVAAFEGVRLLRRRGAPGRSALGTGPGIGRTAGRLSVQVAGFLIVMGGLAGAGWDPVASVRVAIAADAMVMGTGGGAVQWLGIGVANLAAWGIGCGLATMAIFASLPADLRATGGGAVPGARPRLPDAFIAAVALPVLAAFSTLFTLEVERIWILFNLTTLVGLFAVRETASRESRPEVGVEIRGDAPGPARAFLGVWIALLVAQTLLTEVLAETRW